MCGIAGLISASGEQKAGRVPAILERLRHRGPDDMGYALYSSRKLQFGRKIDWSLFAGEFEAILMHLRLSILDLSDTGWQPMKSSDNRYLMVYNGEIYNFLELRAELEHLGHRFHSRSDSEVLLAAYSQWGSTAFLRFIGMFALAILDTRDRKLVLARDFFGIKPLYYTRGEEGFAFASELKALLAFDLVDRRINPNRLYQYLRYGISDYGTNTLLAEVFQVPAAHYMEVSLNEPLPLKPVCYWKPMSGTLDISFDDAVRQLRELFLKNVWLHLRSDVPVGAALSGGIDSSSIVMAIRHLQPNAELHTFSYIADDASLSEEKWVDVVGSTAKAYVHKVSSESTSLLDDLDHLIYFQDEPFGSTSIYAQYCVFRDAKRQGIKVMLDGQGADEVLGGYRYHMAARLASLVRQKQWHQATEFLKVCSRLPGSNGFWLLQRAADYLLPAEAAKHLRGLVGKELAPSWMNPGWFHDYGVEPQSPNHPHGEDVLRETLWQDLTQTSLPYLLRYEDRNSMAFSIESRVPFLTAELVSFLLALPEEYIIGKDGTSKAVFRAAMKGIVPDCILGRKDKIGFQTPEGRWLERLAPWVQAMLDNGVAREIPAFNLEQIKQEWQLILRKPESFDHRVWRWINLIKWTTQFQVVHC